MDVDDPARVLLHETSRHDLHVPREDDEVDPLALRSAIWRLLDLRLVLLRDGERVERDAERPRDGLEVGVVRDDERHLGPPLARARPREEVVEAGRVLRDEDGQPRHLVRGMQRPGDVEPLPDEGGEGRGDPGVRQREIRDVPAQARVVVLGLGIDVLVVVEDPPAVVVDEPREARRDPEPERAVEEEGPGAGLAAARRSCGSS